MDDHPKLNLHPDEKRLFAQLFKEADTSGSGFITGDVAVNFFGRTGLPQQVLGAIWDLVDPDNRGFLLQEDFAKAMRLIGHSQANPNRPPDLDLASKPAPLPVFQGFTAPTGIRVPPLSPDDAAKYVHLFEQTGASNGVIGGDTARQFFMRSGLPNDILIAVWNLADTEQRGSLGLTEFIVAMHLLTSYKSRSMTALPKQCPPALFEAASRMAARPPTSAGSTIPRQFSGTAEQRTTGLGARGVTSPPAGSVDWIVASQKPQFDEAFDKLDPQRTGFVSGEQAANYFRNSALPEGILAQIWDLANIRKADQLNRDEFAVAMYLIRTQRRPDRPELPQVLPMSIVPPSLRSAVSQTSAPAQPNAAPLPTAPKSAAEDLFGLDDIPSSSPVTQVTQQTTGGSSNYNEAFGGKPQSPVANRNFANASGGFKPFVPTSSFGQGLQTQNTGGSAASAPREVRSSVASPAAMDDLLGDADPEISKKLTQDTAELANMSNQIGQLRNQMQDVQSKKATGERDLTSTTMQKRDLEMRLSQFRKQYESEANAVKEIEKQLGSVRAELQTLQRDFGTVEREFQDLSNQRQQATAALEAERRDNASLKERMGLLNQEIARLRPEVEKIRQEARHEKGMASINKKQLEKSESERDALKAEMDRPRSVTHSEKGLTAGSRDGAPASSPPVASPASQSTNPFFRRSPQPSSDAKMTPSSFAARSPAPESNTMLDSLWGTAFTPSGAPSATVSAAPFVGFEPPSVSSQSSSEPSVPTPSASPPASSYKGSPRVAGPTVVADPRHLTATDLPLRGSGGESSASMRVETPASRREGPATPTAADSVSAAPNLERSSTTTSTGAVMFDRPSAASPTTDAGDESASRRPDDLASFSRPSTLAATIPGAFPGTAASPLQSNLTGESSFTSGSKENARSESFVSFAPAANRGPPSRNGTAASSSSKGDFDAVFASRSNTGTFAPPRGNFDDGFGTRFPPVNSLVNEDNSESDSEADGFDDDFTASSPARQPTGNAPSVATTEQPRQSHSDDTYKPRTATGASAGDLPPFEAQKSPPLYAPRNNPQSGAVGEPSGPPQSTEDANSAFPPEFGGLLPQRETSMSAPQPPQSPSQGANLFGGAPVSRPTETTSSSTARSGDFHSATSQPGGPAKTSSSAFGDEFDAGFDDLEDARQDDDKGEELFSPSNEHSFEEFNPTFDSPAGSKSNTLHSDFDNGFAKSSSNATSKFSASDWDNLMSSSSPRHDFNLSSSKQMGFNGSSSGSKLFNSEAMTLQSTAPPEAPEPPKLARAISQGTEHDDPILKQLTSMGYDRNLALQALEKYDYNLDKAADHLSSPR